MPSFVGNILHELFWAFSVLTMYQVLQELNEDHNNGEITHGPCPQNFRLVEKKIHYSAYDTGGGKHRSHRNKSRAFNVHF